MEPTPPSDIIRTVYSYKSYQTSQTFLTKKELRIFLRKTGKTGRLYSVYLLKEQVLDIFDEQNQTVAVKRFDVWSDNVTQSGLRQFDNVLKTIKTYFYGIANYFKHRITNGGAEGINNKINVIKRMAYGFKDIEYFKLKILQSCGWRAP